MKHVPEISRKENGGTQDIYRFANGYGASVIHHKGSYGYEQGLYELAFIKYPKKKCDADEFEFCNKNPLTGEVERDILGWLTSAKVEETLSKIKKLGKLPEETRFTYLEPEETVKS